MKDSEVVAAARELISDEASWIKNDWCKGTPDKVKMCAEGAVRMAVGELEWDQVGLVWKNRFNEATSLQSGRVEETLATVAYEMFPTRIQDQWGESTSPLVLNGYNDATITRHEDVLAIFDETHRRLVEAGQ